MQHIHKLGLENFRLFKEMREFDFAPITLFTGVNNSGKSSVIKSLLLLKESFNKSANLSELLFTESKHNLGSFNECIHNHNNKNKYLIFKFQLPSLYFIKDCYIELEYKSNSMFAENGTLLAFRILYKDKELINIIRNIELEESEKTQNLYASDFLQHIVNIKINLELIVKLLKANCSDNKKPQGPQKEKKAEDLHKNEIMNLGSLNNESDIDMMIQEFDRMNSSFHSFFINPQKYQNWDNKLIDFNEPLFLLKDKISGEIILEESFNNALKQKIRNLYYQGLSIEETGDLPNTAVPTLLELYLQSLYSVEYYFSTDNIEINSDHEIVLSELGRFVFYTVLKDSVKSSFKLLQKATSNIYSLSSLRGNTERLYSNNSNIVDINNIIIQFLGADIGERMNFLNSSLKLFNIGDKISITRHQGVVSEIFIHRGSDKILLADMGFGYTQLLPIIIKVAIIASENSKKDFVTVSGCQYSPSILLLEEPESNLHPSFQSKLADFIIDAASKFNIQFIIETHSEYFIRKLQYLVAKKELKPRDISLFYFHEPGNIPKGEKQVKKIEIQKDGSLSEDFGSGFFDEALSWKFELLKLKNKN